VILNTSDKYYRPDRFLKAGHHLTAGRKLFAVVEDYE